MTIDGVPTQEPQVIPRPPVARATPRVWIRRNLFDGARSTVLTFVGAAIVGFALYRGARFVFVTAHWRPVRENLTTLLVGFFPRDQVWRPWVALFVIVVAFGFRTGASARAAGRPPLGVRAAVARFWPLAAAGAVFGSLTSGVMPRALIALLFVAAWASRTLGRRSPRRLGRWSALFPLAGTIAAYLVIAAFGGVGYDQWRGLLLTGFLAIGGIALSFPFGVLLALGRRSSLPTVRTVCTAYIELIRGVPLITLLFMGAFALGFFLPPGSRAPSLVTRALVAFVLFTAAYIAEIVRGGLQSVPRGQVEAAQALGMGAVTVTGFIVLPQALRAVIPATVGQFISLFKDTSLAAGIGLIEMLAVAHQQIPNQPEFVGRGVQAETLVFASFVYWVGAYWMSRSSQRLERRLRIGER